MHASVEDWAAKLGGAARQNAGAFDVANGAITNWNPAANGEVRTFLAHSGAMLTGGTFTSIGNETRGRLAALDPATGCVAYWLLTGQHVFSATTPKALDRLVLSCLAKDPRDLSASAKRLSRQLEELRNGNPWTQERAREWWAANQPATP